MMNMSMQTDRSKRAVNPVIIEFSDIDITDSDQLRETAESTIAAVEMFSSEPDYCLREDTRFRQAAAVMLMSAHECFDASLESGLMERGHRVIRTKNAIEAVKRFQTEEIGVVITDASVLSEIGATTLSVCKNLNPECMIVLSTDCSRGTLGELTGDGKFDLVVSSSCRFAEVEDAIDAISIITTGASND